MARVDNHGHDPLCVLQPRASQDEVLIIQVDKLLVAELVYSGANWTESALKSVEEVIGRVTDYVALEAAQLARGQVLENRD